MDNFLTWYSILGIITVIIGIVRFELGKQDYPPNLSTLITWFFLWWFWLGFLIVKIFKK